MLSKCQILVSMSLIFCINLSAAEAVQIVPASTCSRLSMEQYLELKELVSLQIREGMENAEVHEVALADDIFPEIAGETLIWIVSSKENYQEALQRLIKDDKHLLPPVLDAAIHLGISRLREAGQEVVPAHCFDLAESDSVALLEELIRLNFRHKSYRVLAYEVLLVQAAMSGLKDIVASLLAFKLEMSEALTAALTSDGLMGLYIEVLEDIRTFETPQEFAVVAAAYQGHIDSLEALCTRGPSLKKDVRDIAYRLAEANDHAAILLYLDPLDLADPLAKEHELTSIISDLDAGPTLADKRILDELDPDLCPTPQELELLRAACSGQVELLKAIIAARDEVWDMAYHLAQKYNQVEVTNYIDEKNLDDFFSESDIL